MATNLAIEGESERRRPTRLLAWAAAVCLPALLGWGWVKFAPGHLPPPFTTFTGLIVLALVAASAYTDVRWRKIPNWVTYSAVFWALIINVFTSAATKGGFDGTLVTELGGVGIGSCLFGLLACFFVKFFAYSVAKGGAGDVKLAAALGALLGVELGILALCYAYVFAGVAALCWVIWRLGPVYVVTACGRFLARLLFPFLFPVERTAEQESVMGTTLPLGIFFAIGTPLAMLGLPDLIW